MTQARLDEWAVVYGASNPFTPPEAAPICLVGRVSGHPRKPDGTRIKTSDIIGVSGKRITTRSGTVYELGNPEEGYLAWLSANRPDWDPENPIKLVRQ